MPNDTTPASRYESNALIPVSSATPRQPVAMSRDRYGGLVMACTDGSCWCYAGSNGWERMASVPGTPAEAEEQAIYRKAN